MKIFENLSWLKAGLVVAGVHLLYSLFTTVLGIIPPLVCLKCLLTPLTCIIAIASPIISGYLAAHWGKIKRNETEQTLAFGALSGLTYGIVTGIISIILSIVGSVLGLSVQTALSNFNNNDNSIGALSILPFNVASSIICGLFGIIILIIVSVFLSALGSIIYTAIKK